MKTSPGSAIVPRSASRRPSSHAAIRPSWITRTIAVLDRSRPRLNVAAELRPTSNAPSDSASPANAVRTRSASSRRSRSRAAFSAMGEASSSAIRMRSTAARAVSGSSSHTRAIRSHSLAPRDPNSPRNRSNSSTNAIASACEDARSLSLRPAVPPSNSVTQRSRRAHRPRHPPHRKGRSSRVDAPEAGHQSHGPVRLADRSADLRKDARPDRRADRLVDVLVEHPPVQRPKRDDVAEQRAIRHLAVVRPLRTNAQRLLAVGLQLLLRDVGRRPCQPSGHHLAGSGVGVPVLGDVRRHVGVVAEVHLVDRGRRHARRAAGPHPEQRCAQVRVPAEDADHLRPERIELLVGHAETLHEQVSPTRHGGAFPHDVPTQRRWWFGKHLAHVGARPKRVARLERVLPDPPHGVSPRRRPLSRHTLGGDADRRSAHRPPPPSTIAAS